MDNNTSTNNIDATIKSYRNKEDYQLKNKIDFVLHLADNALILSQRNSDWCGHGPALEQDIALTNIALDLIGQARNYYQYAAQLIMENKQNLPSDQSFFLSKIPTDNITEDTLAYFRTEREFKNCLLVEQPNDNWGQTIFRQFLFSTYQYLLYQQLQNNQDNTIAAIAAKAFKEVAYHVKWSSEWVIRLGDGTEESHQKMLDAMEELWPYTGEFFIPESYENEEIAGFNLGSLKSIWIKKTHAVLQEASLLYALVKKQEQKEIFMQTGGKKGIHSEHMGFILTELQYLQRTYPNSEW